MRRILIKFVLLASLFAPAPTIASAQATSASAPVDDSATGSGASSQPQTIDGIAARIEDDIITKSEVRELGAFQELLDGKPKPRSEIIKELADQWIVRGEAAVAAYPPPSKADVERAYEEFVKQFSPPEEYRSRLAHAGLTEAVVRRIVEQQLFLSRFIDYRFRPAAQVDQAQIQAYYRDEFAPQLAARKQPVPPLEDVEDTIREVLVQRAINERATKWLDETREHLRIDVVQQGAGL